MRHHVENPQPQKLQNLRNLRIPEPPNPGTPEPFTSAILRP